MIFGSIFISTLSNFKLRVQVSGNLKFDSVEMNIDPNIIEKFQHRFALAPNDQLIIAASTHAPEEQVAIAAIKKLKASLPKVRLLIAPRHPERFGEVSALLQGSGLRWSRRSNPPAIDD